MDALTPAAPTAINRERTTYAVFQDRPVYRAASNFASVSPYVYAGLDAAWAKGNRVDKFNAGSDSLAYWLGFRAFNTLYQKFLAKLYQRHPALADKVNQHPVAAGLIAAGPGIVLAHFGAKMAQGGWQMIRQKLEKPISTALFSCPGDGAARLLAPLGRVLNHPAAKIGIILGFLGFVGTLLVRMIQDAGRFGKAYRETRKQEWDADPYQLKQQVLQQMYANSARLQGPGGPGSFEMVR